MDERDTPKIVRTYDDDRLERDGSVKQITVVRVMYGQLGPFVIELPRTHTETDLNQAIDARLAPYGWRRF